MQSLTPLGLWSAVTRRRFNRGTVALHPQKAFTLVELLVVITIIVVLLALLVPALEKAVYQAELTMCGANHHALGLGISSYALEHKRSYPYRGAVHDAGVSTWPMNISFPSNPAYDDRRKLRPYISINKTLNCPLSPTLDIDGSRADTYTFGAYNLWFGFQYRRVTPAGQKEKGMLRLGDRWEWHDEVRGYTLKSNLLSGSRYIDLPTNNPQLLSASHPGESYYAVKLQDQFIGTAEAAGMGVNGARYTFMRWDSLEPARGDVDLTEQFADLSVVRFDRVDWFEDPRMARAPGYSSAAGWPTNHWELVPKN